jgi:hypothetical protein
MPAQAGFHLLFGGVRVVWIPAFAGMTWVILAPSSLISGSETGFPPSRE